MKTERKENINNRLLKGQHYYYTINEYPNIFDYDKTNNYGRNFSMMETYNIDRIFEAAVYFNRYFIVKWMLDKYGSALITKELAYPIYSNMNRRDEEMIKSIIDEIGKHIPHQMWYDDVMDELMGYIHTCPIKNTLIEGIYVRTNEYIRSIGK